MEEPLIKLGIVGVGKIVKDQHIPSLRRTGLYELVATASPHSSLDDVPAYRTIEGMLDFQPELDAVALCMPPQYRYRAASYALEQGLHVLLEKPPGATVHEVEEMADLARQNCASLYTTWHARYGAAVEHAKAMLSDAQITSVQIEWKEDVRKWHPDQQWIWQAGGLGVFDPGINALSILTHILPSSLKVVKSDFVFPNNKTAPIAAQVSLLSLDGFDVHLELDWRVTDREVWSIEVRTNKDLVTIGNGGASLEVGGEGVALEDSKYGEYEFIYRRFAELIRTKKSDVDSEPLKLVAEAFLLSSRETVEAFNE